MFSKRLVGVDIGSADIKLVELQKSGGTVRVMAAERIRLPDDAPDWASTLDAVQEPLRAFLSSRRRVLVVGSVPPQEATEKIIELPPTDLDTVNDVMKFEAETHIPLPLDAVNFDHVVVRADTQGTGVLLAAAPRHVLNALNSALQKAGAKLYALGTPGVALLNTLRLALADALSSSSGLMLADIGARHTQVIVVANDQPRLVRTVSIGSDGLTEALCQDGSLSPANAETRKRERGLASDADLTPAVQMWLNRLADELRRVIQGFRAVSRTGSVERLYLTGGGALTLGLPERLTELVGVPTQLLPTEGVVTSSVNSLSAAGRDSVGFATAIGLALSANGNALAVNLMPTEHKRQLRRALPRPLALGITAGAIAAVVLTTAGLQSMNAEQEDRLRMKQKQLRDLVKGGSGTANALLLQRRVAAMKELEKEVRADADRWLSILRELSAQLPENVSVTEIIMEKHRAVSVRGVAKTNELVAESLRVVRAFPDFVDVRLDYASGVEIEGQPVVEFQLLCRLPAPQTKTTLARRTPR
ncbi:MAG: type IV pilus assembly protein PilM [Abditibacteriales bacterium]|nr:type IV pilus assembly protein PilM [Abditibacteriales bacterium]